MKERHKSYEERAYSVMINQEKITEKWKEEHRKSVQYFERAIKNLEVENRHFKDQCIELKGKMRHMQKDVGSETTVANKEGYRRKSSKSRDNK